VKWPAKERTARADADLATAAQVIDEATVNRRRRVLAARLDNLGDVLLTGPAIRAMARSAEVVLVCGPHGSAAAHLLPGVARLIEFDAPWVGFRPASFRRGALSHFVEEVRAAAVDDAVVFTSDHQSPLPLAMLLREAGVDRVCAYSHDYPGSLLDVRQPEPGEVHEVERALLLAAAAGYPQASDDDGRLRTILPSGPMPADVARLGRPYVVLHPGASVPARALPAPLASDALARLTEAGWAVVLTGTPAETRAVRSRPAQTAGDVIDLSGRLSWPELGRVLDRAAVAVCGNTGPAHLAASVGTPVVSVFAPVVPVERWRPWGVPHVVLGDQALVCRGCRARTCPRDLQECLVGLNGSDVLAAVDALARPEQARLAGSTVRSA
jgi:heptosyltransferase-3